MKFWHAIILLLIAAIIVIGISIWQPWQIRDRSIIVTSQGKIQAIPDVADIQGGVETIKPTSAEAQKETTSKINTIINALRAKGIADQDIKTTEVTAYPNYNYSDNQSTITGYTARTTLDVTVRNINQSQAILDIMTNNNATNLSGPNLTFSQEKLRDLKLRAQQDAINEAQNKARNIANSSKTRLGKIISISETNPTYNYSPMGAEGGGGASPNIQPGENVVTVNLTVTYRLK